MQAKFINVFGQWVHPDFKLEEAYLDIGKNDSREFQGTIMHSCIGYNDNIIRTERQRYTGYFLQGKTIDEVAEEYNRQVDINAMTLEMMMNKANESVRVIK